MRLIIIPAIDQRRKCRHHLCHRYIETLPKGRRCKICLPHILCSKDQIFCGRLSRQVNSRVLSKPKDMLIPDKIFHSDLIGHSHQSHIAGIGDCLIYILCPMP